MATSSVRITGLDQVRKRIRELPDKLRAKALRRAARAGAAVIVAEAKAGAPVRTGAIRRNIVQRPGKPQYADAELRGKNGVRRVIGVVHGRVQESRIRGDRYLVGRQGRTKRLTARQRRREDPWYFRFQELGWSATGRAGRAFRGSGTFQRGKPFLRPALERARTRATAAMREALQRELLNGI